MADQPYRDLKWWLAPENEAALNARLDELRAKAIRNRPVQAGPQLMELLDEGSEQVFRAAVDREARARNVSKRH